ncbi:MAG: hypothetical protein ACI9MR_003369 [Myxococcota bacterium]|jgi:hypothetical protein
MNTTASPDVRNAAELFDRDGHLLELTFDMYLYDTEDVWLQAEVDAHLAQCEPCQAALAAIRGLDSDAAASQPPLRTVDGPSGAVVISLAARRRHRLWAGVGVLAAAAVAVVVVKPWAPPGDGIRLRGGPIQLQVFVKGSDLPDREVATGDRVMAGERFGFRVAAKKPGQLMIIGVDAANDPYLCYPQGTTTSVPFAAADPTNLDRAMQFDEVLGTERIVAVLCDAPFGFDEVASQLSKHRVAMTVNATPGAVLPRLLDGCAQTEVVLLKVPEMP